MVIDSKNVCQDAEKVIHHAGIREKMMMVRLISQGCSLGLCLFVVHRKLREVLGLIASGASVSRISLQKKWYRCRDKLYTEAGHAYDKCQVKSTELCFQRTENKDCASPSHTMVHKRRLDAPDQRE